MMLNSNQFLVFFSLFLFFNGFCTRTAHANQNVTDTKIYIVYLGAKPHDNHKHIKESHRDLLAMAVGSKEEAKKLIIYNYKYSFTGFAAKLTKSQANKVAGLPGVVHVIQDKQHAVQTSRSWDFLGLGLGQGQGQPSENSATDNLLHKAKMGEGLIIGVIDSGIDGTRPSFSDEGYGPVPEAWKGVCKSMGLFIETEHCSRKVIGARWFVKGAMEEFKVDVKTLEKFDDISALDLDGHGTQVASIAAGSVVENVNCSDMSFGVIRGGAPRARLSIYKGCWRVAGPSLSCTSSDLLAAFDYAVHDRVDVISISIGLSVPLKSDVDSDNAIAVGSFHAVCHGIPVIVAAGNDGPSAFTVANVEPWLITVAASTMDRAFLYPIALGNNETIYVNSETSLGTSVSPFYFLGKYQGTAELSRIQFNATEARGRILFIFGTVQDDDLSLVSKAFAAGAVGMIYSNPTSSNLPYNYYPIPCIQVDFNTGTRIKEYIVHNKNPTAKMGFPDIYTGKPLAPKVVAFSSRGPSSLDPTILKPDVAAPGDKILCASPLTDNESNKGFTIASGTSQAAPHVSGIVTLLKASHPEWSPAAIKSALVTTAWNSESYTSPIFAAGSSDKLADAFDFGGGIANAGADDPGLVYDMKKIDYIKYDCALGYNSSEIYNITKETPNYDVKQERQICPKTKPSALDLNLPSIVVPDLNKPVTIHRTVTNVGPPNSVYNAMFNPPLGTTITVKPNVLSFDANTHKRSFTLEISAVEERNTGFTFGSLTWTDGVHFVRSPIAVKMQYMALYF
ncbi:PREDICTED: subtilisin-like protease SBT3.3 [Ipomoea nil]|uniref:subtilisin-like protease SBT3.3 n=1 Tax=Ipomoea nil TaxID=35883 RepID=UPI000900AE85|nr:PREDICTED: subtilisin-like protease SBT3.3 [Ipomoea nil]